jgi:hypothetical protein
MLVLGRSTFSKLRDKKGLSNPHAELNLIQKPCIKVPGSVAEIQV